MTASPPTPRLPHALSSTRSPAGHPPGPADPAPPGPRGAGGGRRRRSRWLAGALLAALLAGSADAAAAQGLVVLPKGGLAAVKQGTQPVAPAGKVYFVANAGPVPIVWAAAGTDPWVRLSAAAGFVPPYGWAATYVDVPHGSGKTFPAGLHESSVLFLNLTNGKGSTVRPVVVDVKVPPSGDGPVLVPGSGFAGPTQDPPAVGGGPGVDAKAIARFDVVPFQSFSGELELGVVAFHANGISRVELSAEGGPWTPVTKMTANPRTGVTEYWAVLRAQDLPDGPVEVRAIAYPTVGKPRLLPPLRLHANGGGSLSPQPVHVSPSGSDATGAGTAAKPYRTLMKAAHAIQEASGNGVADGGTIYLTAGSHSYGAYSWPLKTTTEETWLTIRPAPGLAKGSVRLTSADSSGLRTKLVKLQDLTIETSIPTTAPEEDYLWLDGCDLVGAGQFTDTPFVNQAIWTDHFVTSSTIRDNKDGLKFGSLQREVHLESIGSDAFGNNGLVVNCSVRGMDPGPKKGDWHPDLFQFSGSASTVTANHIVYGLEAYDLVGIQGLFADDVAEVNDVAFVNVMIEANGGKSQWKDVSTNHLLLWGVTIVDQMWAWRTPNLKNVSVRGSVFEKMTQEFPFDESWVLSNHFIDATSYAAISPGADVSTGDPKFANPLADDYRPGAGSVLKGRLSPLSPMDVGKVKRKALTSAGAFD